MRIPTLEKGQTREIACSVTSAGGNRMELISSERIPASTAITVEYNDALFLSEVVACTQDVSGTWHIETKIEQILTGLQSLMNLRANLLGEGTTVTPARMSLAATCPSSR